MITLSNVLNSIMRHGNEGVRLSSVVMNIGSALETEIGLSNPKIDDSEFEQFAKKRFVPVYGAQSAFNQRLRKILLEEEWPPSAKVQHNCIDWTV